MNRDENEQHAVHIDEWIEQTIREKSPEQQLNLFGMAVRALRNRTVQTLSLVTWEAIIDRTLHQSQHEFPILSELKVETGNILVSGELKNFNLQRAEKITEAFRFFLIELLTIIENLTAGILTAPLYNELNLLQKAARTFVRKDRGHK